MYALESIIGERTLMDFDPMDDQDYRRSQVCYSAHRHLSICCFRENKELNNFSGNKDFDFKAKTILRSQLTRGLFGSLGYMKLDILTSPAPNPRDVNVLYGSVAETCC